MCLKMHLKTHINKTNTKKLTVTCNRKDYGKRFSCDASLKEHLKIHDNDIFKCAFCPWGGAQFDQFSSHMNKHFRKKLFECSQCPDRFYKANSLNQHMEAIHEKDLEKYTCEICQFKTYAKANLNNHKKAKHMNS